jgi:SWI/SNF-related matrix-associated actin-dependent regulator 1 of chromatin subfamily A
MYDEQEQQPRMAWNGYEGEAGTRMLATQCLFCHKDLRDPASVERGVGPYCAQKHGVFTSAGAPDETAYQAALETAPAPLREAVEARGGLGDPRGSLSAAIHAAGNAWERHTADRSQYLGATMELARALGFENTARVLQNIYIEGKKYNEQGEQIDTGKRPPGIVVKEHPPSRSGQPGWELVLPYLDNRAVWSQTKGALKSAGVVTYKDPNGRWHDVFPQGDRQWLLVLNAMVDTLGGTLGVLPDGETFVVPYEKLPVPAPEGDASGAPDRVDAPPPPKPPEVKEGDRVELHDGRVMIVARTGVNSKGPWVGLMTEKAAKRDMLKLGYLNFRKAMNAGDGCFVGAADVKAKKPTEAEQRAVEHDSGEPIPAAVAARDLPEGLRDWQREGAIWLGQKHSGVLAMEQGTGKTPTALAALVAPALVVVPASLRENWKREAMRWRPDLVVSKIEKAAEATPEALQATCAIIGYEGLNDEDVLLALMDRGFQTLIVDEAHALKELLVYTSDEGRPFPAKSSPKRAAAVFFLSQKIPHRFFLTGTPMVNGRPYELWPLLHLSAPKDWPDQKEYWYQFCDPEEVHIPGGDTRLNYNGRDNLPELRERIMGHYLWRCTKDVLGLPDKQREYLAVGMSEDVAQEYRAAASEFLAWVRQRGGPHAAMRAARAEVIARLTALRRLAGLGKVPVTIERAERHLRDTGRPLIIMGHHEEALASIESALSTLGFRVGSITGKVTGKARQRAVDEFQSGLPANKPPEKRKYLDVLVCSITAAGVGLTLTRAQDMIIFERVWRPFDLVQAEDRIHRYGQENKVVITYIDAAGTIDDKLAALLAEKAETAGQVLDGDDLDEDEAQDRVVRDMFGQLTESMQANSGSDLDAAMFDWANPDIG